MADRITPAERSAVMQRIRKTDTRPEIVVRRAAYALGFRFRLHRRDLPGTPDLCFPGLSKVIFVHGCFWHLHARCRLARPPKSRLDYWLPKLERNIERDRTAIAALRRLGWKTLVIWECETRKPELFERKLRMFLGRWPAASARPAPSSGVRLVRAS
ncbi:MAG: DNA mismatch endonuclease Vsr [Proteobacteria bacterium]|nr:DNA mismatch endonuclease Vsr [Pseudomonadota bacterium]